MAHFRPGTLRGKLFVIIAVLYLSAVLLEAVLYVQWYRMRRDIEINQNLDLATEIAVSIHTFFTGIYQQQMALGLAVAELEPGSIQQVQDYLNENHRLYPIAKEICWFDPGGVIQASTDPTHIGLSYARSPFVEALQQGKPWSISNLIPPTATEQPYFYIISAISHAPRSLKGLVAMSLTPDKIEAAIWEAHLPKFASITVYDRAGTLVWFYPRTNPPHTAPDKTDPLLQQALKGEEAGRLTDDHFTARVPIDGLGWVAGVERPLAGVMPPIRRNLVYNGLAMMLIGAAALYIAARISKQIILCVQSLRRHAEALRAGDLEFRSTACGVAELDDLAVWFNQASRALDENLKRQEDMMNQLRQRENELNAANQSLIQDIEFRKRMVAAIREAEMRAHRRSQELEAVLNTVPAAVFIAQDPQCDFVTGNAAAYRMFRVPEGTNLSKTPKEEHDNLPLKFYRDGKELQSEQLFLQLAIKTGEEVRNEETQLVDIDGTIKTVYGHAAPYRDDQGNVAGAVATLVDITERKKAEDELRRSAQELERSNLELERFAYVASHDLQEPLRMVVSYLTLLAQRYSGKLDTQADDFIRFATEGGMRMQAMINDLLHYSRVQRSPVVLRPVDTNAALQVALNNLKVLKEETGAIIEAQSLPAVYGNFLQISQLLQNIIGNALKFHAPDRPPRVLITASPAQQDKAGNVETWLFSVQDNGIGIPRESWEDVFTIFNRLKPRSQYPGSGMGLAICRKIVEKHGGSIWIESEPGQYTTVYFTLAAADIEE